MDIPNKLNDEIWNYCRLNNISNVDEFMVKMIRQGFTSEKYGSTPIDSIKPIEVEKIIEVPIEVIKEVVVEKEIIKEVPVEKIVTKIEYISDKTSEIELSEKVNQLTENILQLNGEISNQKKSLSTKIEEMENSFQQELEKKDKEIEELKNSLEEEKKNKNKKDDLYGDDRKGGWWGSNLLK